MPLVGWMWGGAIAALSGWVVHMTRRQAALERANWRALTETLGLTETRGDQLERRLDGQVDGVEVHIAEVPRVSSDGSGRRITFRVGPVPRGLHLQWKDWYEAFGAGSANAVGDAAFDRRFVVLGDEALGLALLDADARRRLLALPAAVEIRDGWLVPLEAPGMWSIHTMSIEVTRALAMAARDVRQAPEDVARALGQRALREGTDEARLRLVQVLAGRFRGHPQVRETIDQVASTFRGELRWKALEAAGAPPHWVDLVRDPLESDDVRARALMRVGPRLEPAALSALVGWILAEDRDETMAVRRAGLRQLALPGGYRLMALVRRLSAEAARARPNDWHADEAVVEGLVEALAAHGVAEDERWIVTLLPQLTPKAQATALGWLRRKGTVYAVETLAALEREASGRHRARFREVVEAIQGRLVDPGAGRVSLVDAVGGEVSVARDGAGGLSEPEGGP